MSAHPARPNLDFYKKQAKALLKLLRAGDPDAADRIRDHHPRFRDASAAEITAVKLQLADAQLVIARETGHSSWQQLKEHVELIGGMTRLVIEWSDALSDRDLPRIEALLREHEQLKYQQFHPREKLPGYHSATYGPLLWAVMIEEVDIVRMLLAHGADPNHESQSCLPLLLASENMSDLLISHGADVNRYCTNGGTPLMWGVSHLDRVRYLIDHGADVNLAKPNSGETPLMMLMGHENEREALQIAKLLLRHGADVNARTRSGVRDEPIYNHGNDQSISQGRMTALHLAAEFGQAKLAAFLLDHGADPQAKTVSRRTVFFGPEDKPFPFEPFAGETPLDWAVRSGHQQLVQLLGGDVAHDLYWAAASGAERQVEKLLRTGADLNQVNAATGQSPLDAAAAQGRSSICKILLARGAHWRGDVASAIELGLPDVVRSALESDPSLKERLLADPRMLLHLLYRGGDGNRQAIEHVLRATPTTANDLPLAIGLRDLAYCSAVLARFPSAMDQALRALRELACYIVWDTGMLQSALDAGADIKVRDQLFHGTPLHWSIKLDRPDSVELLLSRGADPNAILTIGDADTTPLLQVVQQRTNCRMELVEPLLQHGADPNWQMHNGYTALDILHQRWGRRPEAEYDNAIKTLRRFGGKTAAELAGVA